MRRFLFRVAVLAGLLVASTAYMLWGTWPVFTDRNEARILYEVPEHTTARALVQDLHERKLIAFPHALRVVLRVTGWETRIRAGYYYLAPSNSVISIARRLTFGEMATRAMTIPEGKASWEIFGILNTYFPLDSLVFDSLVNSPEFAASLGVEASSLEGYLYPDTYIVPWKLKEKDVLAMMVNRFHEVIADMPLEDNAFIRKHGVHGLVTLASIVEKEAAVRREQRRIAGVFHNRLRKGWSLGADPTVRFAVRKMTATLRRDDLAINSPYNTRRFRGLPPGPICSPGEDALRATLNPEKTTMMFFVAKDDGSREHFFTETYAEHNRYKDIAAGNRARQRTLAVAGGAPATEGADTLAPGARQDKTVAGPDLETAPTPAGASKLREPALQEGKPVRGRDQRIVETP
ncbi:MAG TPA: endolytic transglycosylase MltG [Fibrobacteria bacterium]|nr:endolytic transglycosylase MltG [Fibrobacteria bacterium]